MSKKLKSVGKTLEDLPVDCFNIVCLYVPRVSTITKLRLVSSGINSIITHPDFRGSVNAGWNIDHTFTVESIVANEINYVRRIKVNDDFIPLQKLHELLKRFPRLLEFQMLFWIQMNPNSNLSLHDARAILNSKINIFETCFPKHLTIPISLLNSISIRGLEMLNTISITSNSLENGKEIALETLTKSLVKLRVLRMENLNIPKFRLSNSVKLHVLEMTNCRCVIGSHFFLHQCIRSLRSMKIINRRFRSVSVRFDCSSTSPTFTNLTNLHIELRRDRLRNNSKVFVISPSTVPMLQHLSLFGVHRSTIDGVFDLQTLKSLHICCCRAAHSPPKLRSSYKHHRIDHENEFYVCESCENCKLFGSLIGGCCCEICGLGKCDDCLNEFSTCRLCAHCGKFHYSGCKTLKEVKFQRIGFTRESDGYQYFCGQCYEKSVTICQICKITHLFDREGNMGEFCKNCKKYFCRECSHWCPICSQWKRDSCKECGGKNCSICHLRKLCDTCSGKCFKCKSTVCVDKFSNIDECGRNCRYCYRVFCDKCLRSDEVEKKCGVCGKELCWCEYESMRSAGSVGENKKIVCFGCRKEYE